MKIVSFLIVAVLVLLSIAAGFAKVLQVPQEVAFLQNAGLSILLIIVFGLVQISGGILLVPQKTRMVGAVLAVSAFALSTVFIVMTGNFAFGLFSLLPVALASVVIYQAAKAQPNQPLSPDTPDQAG